MTLTPNGFHRFSRVPPSWRSLPLSYPSISNMDGRSLFCTGCLLSRWTLPLGPSAFLQPLFRLARPSSSSMKLTVRSSYCQSLFPVRCWNLLVEKDEQKRVHYQGWSYVLLKRPLRGYQLAHFLLWEFWWSWLLGRPLSLSLNQGTFSSFCPCTRSLHLFSL